MGLAPLSACEEARRRDSSELDRHNEAEETGQVRVNLHGGRDHQGNRANERARPPVLAVVAWDINARTQTQGHRSPSLGLQRGSPAGRR